MWQLPLHHRREHQQGLDCNLNKGLVQSSGKQLPPAKRRGAALEGRCHPGSSSHLLVVGKERDACKCF